MQTPRRGLGFFCQVCKLHGVDVPDAGTSGARKLVFDIEDLTAARRYADADEMGSASLMSMALKAGDMCLVGQVAS